MQIHCFEKHSIEYELHLKKYVLAVDSSGSNGWARVKRVRTKSRERLLRTTDLTYVTHGRNFVVKCEGQDSLVWNQYSHRVDAEVTFQYIRISNLIFNGVLTGTLITLCFALADDLHINILKFVAGHGSVVQPASINIVFGCKQAQQYSRTHQSGFIRAVSWSAQNAESHWSHVHITLTVQHFSFHAILRSVCYSAIWCLVQVA